MYNSIREKRIQRDGMYQITLQIPEEDYFNSYEDLTKKAANEILKNYLNYHQDDGRPDDVEISHNKNAHIVKINANLHYINNDHTYNKR